MKVKFIKEDQISIAYISGISDIVELHSGKLRISGTKTCETCGHIEHLEYDAERTDMIVIEPTLY